jgi:hypothetical protein
LYSHIILTFEFFLVFFDDQQNVARINKHGSQKDQEQKKSGNYFFYDADDTTPAVGEDDDFEDI